MVAAQLPEASTELLTGAVQRGETISLDDFSPQLFYRLLNVSQAELAAMQDVGEELAARFIKNAWLLRRQRSSQIGSRPAR